MSNKICNKCGKELPLTSFYKDKSKKDGYENSCKECRTKSKKKHTIICEVCGKSFKSRSKSSKYCSQECTNIGKGRTITERKANTWVCEVCGKEFTRAKCKEKNENQHHFCSHECSQLFHRGENHCNWNPNLTDEDRSERQNSLYNKWVCEVLERDNYTCQCCGARNGNGKTIKFNVHHKDGYHWCVERRVDITNGVTLCEDCHNEFHNIYGNRNNTEEQFEEFINNNNNNKEVI